jgi:hypothetical protein
MGWQVLLVPSRQTVWNVCGPGTWQQGLRPYSGPQSAAVVHAFEQTFTPS